jgi:hypothetical protein
MRDVSFSRRTLLHGTEGFFDTKTRKKRMNAVT